MKNPQIMKNSGTNNSKKKSAKVMRIVHSKWLLMLFILSHIDSSYGVLIDFGNEKVTTVPNVVTAIERLDLDNGDNIDSTPEIVFERGNSGEEKGSDEIPYSNVVSNVENHDKPKVEQPPFVDLTVNEDVSERPTVLSSTTSETLGSDGPSAAITVNKLSTDSTDNIKASYNPSSTSSFAAATTLKTESFGSTEPPISSVTTTRIDVVSVATDKPIENYTTTSSPSSIEEHSSILSTHQNIASTVVGTTTASPLLTSPLNIEKSTTEKSNNNSEESSTEFRITTSTVINDSSESKELTTTTNVILEITTEFSTIKSLVNEPELSVSSTNIKPTESVASSTPGQSQETTESTATSARLIPSTASAVTPGTSIKSPSTKQSTTSDEFTTSPTITLSRHSSTNTLPKDTYLTSPSPIKLPSAVPTSNADKIEDVESTESIPVKITETIGTEGAWTEVATTDVNTENTTNNGMGLATDQIPSKGTDSIESEDITTEPRPVDNISDSRTESSSRDIGITVISTTLDSLPNNIAFDEDVVEKHHSTTSLKNSDNVSSTEIPLRGSTVIPNIELTSSKKPEDITIVKTEGYATTESSRENTPATNIDNHPYSQIEFSTQDIRTAILSTTLETLPNNVAFDEDVVENHHSTTTLKQSDLVSSTEPKPKDTTLISSTELIGSKMPEYITTTVKIEEDGTKHTITKSSEENSPATEVDNHTDSQIESSTQDIRTAIPSTTIESLPNNVAFDEDVVENHHSTTTLKQSDPVSSTEPIPKDTTLISSTELIGSKKPEDVTTTVKIEEDETKHTITKSSEQSTPATEVDNHTYSQIESSTQDIRTAIHSTTIESLPNNVAFDEDVVENHHSTTTLKQSDPVSSTEPMPKDTTLIPSTELIGSKKPEDITTTVKIEGDETKHTITKPSEQSTPATEVDNHTYSQIESSTQDIRTAIHSTTIESLPNNVAFDEDVVENHHSTTTLKQSDPVSSTELTPKDTTLISSTELMSSKKPEDITTTVKIEGDETKHTITKSSEENSPATEVDNHTDSQIESSTQDIRTAIHSTTIESLPNNVAFDEDVVENHHSTTTLKQSDPVSSTEPIPKDTTLISSTELIGSKKPEDVTTTVKIEEDETKHTITESSEQSTPATEVDNHTYSQIESSTQDIRTAIHSTTIESLPNNVAFDEDVVENHHSTTTLKQSDPVSSTEPIPKDTTLISSTELIGSKKPEDITTTVKIEGDETKHTITKSSKQSTPATEVDNHTDSQIESSTQDIRTAIHSTTIESLPNNVAFDEDVVETHHSTTTLKQYDIVSSTQPIPKDTTLISTTELIGSKKPEEITTVKTEEAENHTTEKASVQSTPAAGLDDNNDLQISTQNIGTTIESTTLEALPDNISFDEDIIEVHTSSVEGKSSTPPIIQSSGFSETQSPLTTTTLGDNLQKLASTIDTDTNTELSVTEITTPDASSSVKPNKISESEDNAGTFTTLSEVNEYSTRYPDPKIEVPSITSDLSESVTFISTVETTEGKSTAASDEFHKSTALETEKWTTSHPSSTKKDFDGPVTMSSNAESTGASTVISNFSKTTATFATEESTLPHPSTTSDLGEPVTFKSTIESTTAPISNSEHDKAASISELSTEHDSLTVFKVISSTETTSMKVTEPLDSVETSIIPEYAARGTSELSNDPSSGLSTTTEHNHFTSHEVVTVTSLNTSTAATYSSTIIPTQLTAISENSKQNSSKESGIIPDHETNLDKPNTGKENGSSKEEVSANKEIPYSNNHTDEKVPQIPAVTEINSEKNGQPPREINSGKESLNFSEKPDNNSISNKEVPYSNHDDNENALQQPFVTDRPDKENPQPSKDELGSNSEKPKPTGESINKEKDSSPKTGKVTIPGEISVDTSTESHLLLNYTKGPLELGNQIKPSSIQNNVVNTNVSKGDSLQNLSNNGQEGPNSDELDIPYTNKVSKDDGDDTLDIPYENKVENIDTTTLTSTEREANEEISTVASSTTLNKATTTRLIQGTSTFKELVSTETTTEYLSTQETLSYGSTPTPTPTLLTSEKTITEGSSIIDNQNSSIETSTTGASERATMKVLHTSEKSSSQSSTHSTNFQNPSTISTNNFTTISTITSNGSESIVSHTEGVSPEYTEFGTEKHLTTLKVPQSSYKTTEVPNFNTESTLFVDPYDMSSTTLIVLTSEKLNILSELTTEPTNIEIVSTTRTTSTSPHSTTTSSTQNSISSVSLKEPIDITTDIIFTTDESIISSTTELSKAGFSSTIKIDEELNLKNVTEMTTKRNDIFNVQNKTSNTQVPTNSSINGDKETEDAKSCATSALTTGLKYGAIGGSAGAMGAVFSQLVKMIADMMKGKDNGNKKSDKDKKDSEDEEHGKDDPDDVEGGKSDGGKGNSEDNSSNSSKQSDLMQELNKKLDKTADEVVGQIDEEINVVEDKVVGTIKDRLTETSNQILGDIKMHMMQGNGNILTNVKSMFADGENNILTDIKKRFIETKSKIFTDVESTIKDAIDQDEDLLKLKEFESEFFKTDETINIKDKGVLHKGLSKSVDNINERIKSQFYRTEQAISYDIEGHMNKTENDLVQEIKTKLPQYSAIINAININMANSKNAILKDVKGKLLQTEILLQEGIRMNMNHVLFTSRQALERRTSWPIVRNDYLGQTCTLEVINEKERLLLKKKSQGVSEKLQEKKLNAIDIINEKLQKGKTDVADVVIKQQHGFDLLKHFRKNQKPLQTISSNVGDNLSGVSDPVKNYRKLSTKSF